MPWRLPLEMMLPQDAPRRFRPSTRKGNLILGGLVFLCLAVAAAFFIMTTITSTAWLFSLYLAAGIAVCFPLPMLSYRLLALNRAFYEMDRNVLRIHWGLRTVVLPLREIEWMRPVEDLTSELPLPRLPIPGALIGIRPIEGLGRVEFMADSLVNGLLVAMPETVYVISPSDRRGFLALFHRSIEMGSLVSIRAESILPSFILGSVWDDKFARIFILTSFLLELGLIIWVLLLVTSVTQVQFGNVLPGQVSEPVSSFQMILFPVLGGFVFLLDLIGGAFFYRNAEQRTASYFLWAGGALTNAMLIIAVLWITLQL